MSETAIRALEEAGLAAWPPATLVCDIAHRLCVTPGHPSKRLNCLTVLDPADSAGGLDRLTHGMQLYERSGLTPTFRQSPLTPSLYAEEMDRRGWRGFEDTDVMTKPLDPASPRARVPPDVTVTRMDNPAAFAALLAALRGHGAAVGQQTLGVLSRVREGLALWRLDEAAGPVAVGMGVDGSDHEGRRLIGLFSITTLAQRRGNGLGRILTQTILADAARRGIARAWLQVEADHEPAQRLYRSQGFTPHHRYRYRVPPGF